MWWCPGPAARGTTRDQERSGYGAAGILWMDHCDCLFSHCPLRLGHGILRAWPLSGLVTSATRLVDRAYFVGGHGILPDERHVHHFHWRRHGAFWATAGGAGRQYGHGPGG